MNTQKSIQTGLVVLIALAILGVGASMMKKNSIPSPSVTLRPTVVQQVMKSYKNGVYTAEGDYKSPAGPEQIKVSLTLQDGIITEAEVTPEATLPKSQYFQGQFASGYKEMVIGKKINEVQLDKVAGSSLTPKGFNDAVTKIMKQAQS